MPIVDAICKALADFDVRAEPQEAMARLTYKNKADRLRGKRRLESLGFVVYDLCHLDTVAHVRRDRALKVRLSVTVAVEPLEDCLLLTRDTARRAARQAVVHALE